MSETLTWWFMALVVGLAALPLCLTLLRRLPDRGYALSKPFGLLLLGYAFWALNVVRILPNTTGAIVIVLLLLVAASAYAAWSQREELLAFARERWRYILTVEALFFLAFVTAAYLRSFTPDLGETEKPMDFMFLNALTHADSYPPEDLWMSGENVPYYYFGYLLVSIMTRLAGVETGVGFNLGLAMIAALAAVAVFGIVYNLIAWREERAALAPGTPAAGFAGLSLPQLTLFGLASVVLLLIAGNLAGIFDALAAADYGPGGFWSWAEIEQLRPYDGQQWYPDQHWFWWKATRIIEASPGLDGIHEFPFFSFMLGDLHPHVMSIPFVLLAAGVALALLRSDEPLDLVVWLERPFALAAMAIVLGALAFLNTWDMPTMALLFALLALIRNRLLAERWSWGLALDTLGFVLPLYLLAFLLYTPFFFGGFDSQASGFSAVRVAGSRWFHMLIHWGLFAMLVLPYAGWRIASSGRRITASMALWALAPAAVVLLVWLGWDVLSAIGGILPDSVSLNDSNVSVLDAIRERGSNWLTVIALSGALGLLVLALAVEVESAAHTKRASGHVFALALAAVAALLILGTEFFFIQDFFSSRMNTIFKLYYQSWIFLSIAGAFALYELARNVRFPRMESQRGAIAIAGAGPWSLGEAGAGVSALIGAVLGLALMPDAVTRLIGALVGGGLFFMAAAAAVMFWRSTAPPAEREAAAAHGLTWRAVWGAGVAVVLIVALTYPVLATWNRTGGCAGHPLRLLEGPPNCGEVFSRRSLDGLSGVRQNNSTEFAAAQWLRDLDGRPVVAQAPGQGYRWDTSRIATIAGLPTVLGWKGHEEQWRGGSDETVPRDEDLRLLYTSGNAEQMRAVIQRYDIRYVVAGPHELETYGSLTVGDNPELFELALESGDVMIYRVRPEARSDPTLE